MSGSYKEASEKYKVRRRQLVDPDIPKHRKKKNEKGKWHIEYKLQKDSDWKRCTGYHLRTSYSTLRAASDAVSTARKKNSPVGYRWTKLNIISLYAAEYRIVGPEGLIVQEKDI